MQLSFGTEIISRSCEQIPFPVSVGVNGTCVTAALRPTFSARHDRKLQHVKPNERLVPRAEESFEYSVAIRIEHHRRIAQFAVAGIPLSEHPSVRIKEIQFPWTGKRNTEFQRCRHRLSQNAEIDCCLPSSARLHFTFPVAASSNSNRPVFRDANTSSREASFSKSTQADA